MSLNTATSRRSILSPGGIRPIASARVSVVTARWVTSGTSNGLQTDWIWISVMIPNGIHAFPIRQLHRDLRGDDHRATPLDQGGLRHDGEESVRKVTFLDTFDSTRLASPCCKPPLLIDHSIIDLTIVRGGRIVALGQSRTGEEIEGLGDPHSDIDENVYLTVA